MSILNIVVEDVGGNPAEVEDAAAWRDQFDLTFEVLADTDGVWATAWGNGDSQTFEQHSYTVLNADGTVAWHQTGHTSTIESEIIEAAEAAQTAP